MIKMESGNTLMTPNELRRELRKSGVTIELWSGQLSCFIAVAKNEMISASHNLPSEESVVVVRTLGRRILIH